MQGFCLDLIRKALGSHARVLSREIKHSAFRNCTLGRIKPFSSGQRMGHPEG